MPLSGGSLSLPGVLDTLPAVLTPPVGFLALLPGALTPLPAVLATFLAYLALPPVVLGPFRCKMLYSVCIKTHQHLKIH